MKYDLDMSSLAHLVVGIRVGTHEIVERVDHALDLVVRDSTVLVDVVEAPQPANAVVERAAHERRQGHEELFEVNLGDVRATKALERQAIVDLLFHGREQVTCVDLSGAARKQLRVDLTKATFG